MERKKALITGAEYGMGRGIALVLAEEGYDIAFSYFPGMANYETALEKTKEMLRERGAESGLMRPTLQRKVLQKSFLMRQ